MMPEHATIYNCSTRQPPVWRRGSGGVGGDPRIERSDLDTSFGDDGQLYTQVLTSSDWATDLVVKPDDKILAVGAVEDGTDYDFALTRHNPDGSPDTSFDSDGKLTTDFGAIDVANAVALQPDDKIVVAGYSGERFGVARYNADGSLDTSFGTDGIDAGFGGNGKVTTDLFGNSHDQALALALGPDGKIILAGDSNSGDTADFALARYNGGAGTKTVYVQYQDRAGNVSAPVRDTITFAP